MDPLVRGLLQREQRVGVEVALVVAGAVAGENRLRVVLVRRHGRSILRAMSDLFADAARERTAALAPLPQRLRPRSLAELVGQTHVLGEGSALRRAIEQDRLRSLILYGPPGSRQDDAGADRRGRDGRRLRGAVGRLRPGRRCPRRDAAGARPARRQRPADDPLPRRDPPLQQGAAGRAPARGRGGVADADRGDDREPVLRGQLGAALALPGGRAGGAVRRGARRGRPPWCGRDRRGGPGRDRRADRTACRRRRAHGALHDRARVGDGAGRGRAARGAPRRRRRAQAAASLRQGRRPALRLRLRLHQVDARLGSRTPPSTTSPRCSRAARIRASSPAGW